MANNILGWLDKAIAALDALNEIIPGKIDDLALSFFQWARNDATFLEWLERFNPPAEGDTMALAMPPEPLVDALRRWHTETGSSPATASSGNWMELIAIVMQVVRWIQARQGQPAPAPVG